MTRTVAALVVAGLAGSLCSCATVPPAESPAAVRASAPEGTAFAAQLPPPSPAPAQPPAARLGKDEPGKLDRPAAPLPPELSPEDLKKLAGRIPLPVTPPPAPPVGGSPPSTPPTPLTLDEVLDSVDRAYPALRAALFDRGVFDGRVLAALGQFDTNLRYATTGIPAGTYENYRADVAVNQRFTGSGVGVFAGYRSGLGDFPVYNLGQKTAEGGEFRAGVSIPLFRDRDIDRQRAGLQQATLERAAVEPSIEAQRLAFRRTAGRVYWAWVAAGRQLTIARSLARLAQDRDAQLRARQVRGIDPEFALVDNLRSVSQRNLLLIQAERAFQRAQVELSLFLRDAAGEPTLAGPDRLPDFPAAREPDRAGAAAAVAAALDARPELRRLRLQREGLEVQRRLAQNQAQPGLNLNLFASQDVGYAKPSYRQFELDRSNLGVELAGDVPWQRRQALGELQQAEARLAQLAAQEKMQADTIRAEVQDAFARLERSFHLLAEARRRADLTRQVADGERRRLDLGLSDILRVTLRELDVFEAEVVEVTASLDYFQAAADLRAATAAGGP